MPLERIDLGNFCYRSEHMEAQVVNSMSLPMELIEDDLWGSIKIFDLGGTLKAAIDCEEIKSQANYGGAVP